MARTSASSLVLVAAGGALGTAARLALGLLVPGAAGLPVAVFTANVVGALLMGVVAARLSDATPAPLFLGAGVLGGFTTYSALAVGAVELWSQPLVALGYAAASLVCGVLAVMLGLRIATPRRAA